MNFTPRTSSTPYSLHSPSVLPFQEQAPEGVLGGTGDRSVKVEGRPGSLRGAPVRDGWTEPERQRKDGESFGTVPGDFRAYERASSGEEYNGVPDGGSEGRSPFSAENRSLNNPDKGWVRLEAKERTGGRGPKRGLSGCPRSRSCPRSRGRSGGDVEGGPGPACGSKVSGE